MQHCMPRRPGLAPALRSFAVADGLGAFQAVGDVVFVTWRSVLKTKLIALACPVVTALTLSGCIGMGTREIEAERAKLHREPLEMGAQGLPAASIDSKGTVKIGSRELALTDTQRLLTSKYRDAVIDLTDLALQDAEQMTRYAVARVLFGMATGRLEKTERKLEQEAEGIAHSPRFCSLLDVVKQRQDVMVQSVAELQPYGRVSRQDTEDCAAGRPYHAGI